MSDSTGASYDEMPYIDAAFPQTHPDRLATVARLFSISGTLRRKLSSPRAGCASGSNLIPMAIDSGGHFHRHRPLRAPGRAGAKMVNLLNLKNIDLRHANVLSVDASFGQFDYIICHGIYSWVPQHVREKILTICRDNLAPQGVAYISYNTLPGWHMMGMVREMMIFHASQFPDARTKVLQARALLDFLAKSIPPSGPYGMALKGVLDMIRPAADGYLFHEYLEDINEPIYFREFAASAAQHGLQYLADADFGSSTIAALPRPVAETLRRVASDMVRMEQYLDFVRNRAFRQSLLIHQGITPERAIGGDILKSLHVASSAQYVSKRPSLVQGVTEAFRVPNGPTATPSNAVTKAALQLLADNGRWPCRSATLATARLRLEPRPPLLIRDSTTDDLPRQDCCNAMRRVSWVLDDVAAPLSDTVSSPGGDTSCPRAGAAQRAVTNLRHGPVRLDAFLRRLLPLLDGTRDQNALLSRCSCKKAVSEKDRLAMTKRSARNGRSRKGSKVIGRGFAVLAKCALLVA
jgi:SAM-dependent methyltransferase